MSDPDLSEFYKLSRPRKPPCRVGIAREQLNAEDRKALDAALATDGGIITGSAIAQWLKSRDLESSSPSISSHRKGTCTCADE